MSVIGHSGGLGAVICPSSMSELRMVIFISLSSFGMGCQLSDEGAYCVENTDCDYLCSHLNECLAVEGALDVRARWTIGGIAPTPADPSSCGSIANFEFHLESSDSRDAVTYFPIPCRLGQVYYDRMPDRFIHLRLTAVDENGVALGVQYRDIETASSEFVIDF